MSGVALSVRALEKRYSAGFGGRTITALSALTLEVPSGVALGVIGPNGAGKTTLIKALLGIVRPTSGEIVVLGGSPDDVAVRSRIGYLPERLHLPAAWSARDFMRSVARLKRLSRDRDDSTTLLARVGLAADADRKVGGYSKGMRQRLGLAAALLGGPDLLILDEPTDGVDPLGRVEIRNILNAERERGATLLLNSHLLSETERVCDRVAILHGGQLLAAGTLDELCGTGTRWRARFAPGYPANELTALGFMPVTDGDELVCEASTPEALDELLARARGAGALLIGLSRDLKDLEQVLAELVKRQAA